METKRAGRKRASDQSAVELIATVSHEIRSPLTTIKGFTKTLLDRWDRLSDQMKIDMLRNINEDADRVTRILTELLDVSRLEAGTLQVHARPVDVRAIAERVAGELSDRSEHHEVVVQSNEPVEVMGDPDKLTQVLTNFIENAQKYTDGGKVSVEVRREDGWGVVEVHDEGNGIPAEQIPELFEKFVRRERAGSPSGTGLGLYICKGLIEAHGGEIGARSVDSGSTFWFRVPAAA
jgi:signal transduction histidine kinase